MDNIYNNWVLKRLPGKYRITEINLKRKLLELNIPIVEKETVIDWKFVKPKYNFFYDYIGNEEISRFLRKSPISNYKNVYIYLNYNDPIIEIDTNTFIDKWEDLLSSTGYSGLLVFTNNGRHFMEFTDDSSYQLYSNFPIKP